VVSFIVLSPFLLLGGCAVRSTLILGQPPADAVGAT